MKRTTKELYGDVSNDILETRNSLANYFISKASKQIRELQKVNLKDRNDALINDCIKAIKHWDKLKEEV